MMYSGDALLARADARSLLLDTLRPLDNLSFCLRCTRRRRDLPSPALDAGLLRSERTWPGRRRLSLFTAPPLPGAHRTAPRSVSIDAMASASRRHLSRSRAAPRRSAALVSHTPP
eukprot:7388831-Prymnesium_polylepis.1